MPNGFNDPFIVSGHAGTMGAVISLVLVAAAAMLGRVRSDTGSGLYGRGGASRDKFGDHLLPQ